MDNAFLEDHLSIQWTKHNADCSTTDVKPVHSLSVCFDTDLPHWLSASSIMVQQPIVRSGRRTAAVVTGLITCIMLIALISLLASVKRSGSQGVNVAAIVLDAIALLVAGTLTLLVACIPQVIFFTTKARRWTSVSITIGLAALACFVTLASLISNKAHLKGRSGSLYALWALSVASQIAFFCTCYLPYRVPPQHVKADSVDHSFTTVDTKKSTSLEMGGINPPQTLQAPLPTHQTVSQASSPGSSVRHSLRQILHPISSRSRLIHQPSFQSDVSSYTERPSTVGRRELNDFDTWEVHPETNFASDQTAKTHKLEPIPGSRPVSPAKALDGPFSPEPVRDGTFLASESPLATPTSPSFPDGRFPFPSRERSSSVATDQSHIHPLFRTDSPLPPPLSSPGTIVTASQWAGQVITDRERAMTRSRAASRTSSRPTSPGLPTSAWIRPSSRASGKSVRPALRNVQSVDQLPQAHPSPAPEAPLIKRQQSFYT